ncbi:uncharacterized protein LOC102368653, partial [Alligator sinensis]|uniref:Uncharacterized protein LOC102368653 n=1 Tax=Alligator sinensis TaxID=38654 RepID=A0A3Q0FRY7_ALLSI
PIISVPQRIAVAGTIVSLPCHVGGFYPKDVDVAWLRDGRVLNNTTPSVPQRNPDGTFSFTLTYTFTSARSDAGSIFSCRVQHLALEQPLREEFPLEVAVQEAGTDRTGTIIGVSLGIAVAVAAAAMAIYCWSRKAPYSVSEVQGPAQYVLGQEVTLRCVMEGTFPEDMAVTWKLLHGEVGMGVGEDGAGAGPEHQPRKDAGLLRPPELSQISVHHSWWTFGGCKVTMSCLITGYFPGELSLTWLRRGVRGAGAVALQDSSEYSIDPGVAVLARDGKRFQRETRLHFTSSLLGDVGAEYICQVGHVALETPIESRCTCSLTGGYQAQNPAQSSPQLPAEDETPLPHHGANDIHVEGTPLPKDPPSSTEQGSAMTADH